MRLKFDYRFPKELKADIERILEKYLDFAPSWCHELTFIWESDPGEHDAAMQIQLLPEYKRAAINVFPVVFEESALLEGSLEWQLVHEMAHLFHGPMFSYINNLVREILPKPLHDTFQEHALENVRLTNEGCAQDFAETLYKLVNQVKPVSQNRRKRKK